MCRTTTILPVHVWIDVPCPACDGAGEIDHAGANPCGDTQYRTCYKCDGKKTIRVRKT
jgi:DnaJ-class molecular chaperone